MIFYFKIGKNVAFGAKDVEVKKPETQVKSKKPVKQAESRELEKLKLKGSDDTSDIGQSPDALYSPSEVSGMEDKHQGDSPILPKRSFISSDAKPVINSSQSAEQPKHDHHKKCPDCS